LPLAAIDEAEAVEAARHLAGELPLDQKPAFSLVRPPLLIAPPGSIHVPMHDPRPLLLDLRFVRQQVVEVPHSALLLCLDVPELPRERP
jgi:hypothetical protein